MSHRRPGQTGLTITAIIMLLAALPLAYWCQLMMSSESSHSPDMLPVYGYLVGAILYAVSFPVGILGLFQAKRADRRLSVAVGILLLIGLIACVIMQRINFLFTMMPLTVLTILYLTFATKR